MGDNREGGWILTHRSIRQSWVWSKKPFSIGQAWIDLILDVNHDDGKFYLNGRLKKIKRGQKWTSIRTLAERWGWQNKAVINFLKALEEDGMITRETTTAGTLLTVVNYGKFQDVRNTKDHTTTTRRGTQKKHGDNETKKNKRRIKEEKKERALPSEDEIEDLTAWEELEDDDATTEH